MSENSPDLEDDTGTYDSGLPGFLGTIDVFISKLEAVMLAAGVLLMALNTCANVISRFLLQQSMFFTGEVNRILIILITFAGIGYAARHGRHIRMSAIFDAPLGRGTYPNSNRKAESVVAIAMIALSERPLKRATLEKMHHLLSALAEPHRQPPPVLEGWRR